MMAIRSGAGWGPARGARASSTLIAVGLLAVAAALLGAAPSAEAKRKTAYIIVDASTGEVLASHRSRSQMHPASLTKMMTLYMAFDALDAGKLAPNQTLVASKRVASMPPSEVGLKRGGKISVRDAINASAVKSANDAAVALAEAIGRTESQFAEKMTARARDLGMRRTRFRNASGLTQSGHLSTAEDMAVLAWRLWIDHRDRYDLFGKRSIKALGRRYRNTNRLLGAEPGVDGLKTGYTRRAGFNLAASAERKGQRVIVVYMGGSSGRARDRRVAGLIDRGFELLKQKPSKPRRRLPGAAPSRENARPDLVAEAPRPMRRPARLATVRPAAATVAAASVASSSVVTASVATATVPAAAGWAVQVGAFKNRDRAAQLLSDIRQIGDPALADALDAVTQAGRSPAGRAVHRARFTGLDEAAARSACRRLKRAGKDCALVPPTGWRAL